jgi:sec-independent protein translocase protein TatA
MPNIGPLEIVIVLVVVLVIFGPKRLPELGKSLGSGMREFKDSITGRARDESKGELGDSSGPATADPARPSVDPAPARTGEPAGSAPHDKPRA